MQKVAIVGVEGSGKTVMLAGLGELYSHPDEEGYFLTPKNYATATYVSEKIARMRKGEWPVATAEDVLQGLDWTLRRRQGERRRPADVCEVSCLDFAGEVYRYAFVREDAVPTTLEDEVAALKNYVRNADDLIVLINLRDIIVHGVGDNRVQEAMWITNAILSYALDEQQGSDVPRAAIVLSQADSYSQTIKSCGGPKGVLAKYLPHVSNNYDWLDVFAVSAVDKTVQDEDGNPVPAPDFTSAPLRKIMDWGVDRGQKGQWSRICPYIGCDRRGSSSCALLWSLDHVHLHRSVCSCGDRHTRRQKHEVFIRRRASLCASDVCGWIDKHRRMLVGCSHRHFHRLWHYAKVVRSPRLRVCCCAARGRCGRIAACKTRTFKAGPGFRRSLLATATGPRSRPGTGLPTRRSSSLDFSTGSPRYGFVSNEYST